MNRLLNKSLKSFTVYALIVLAASVPGYYYLVDSIWLSELDEHNELVAKKTEKEFNDLNLSKAELSQSIALWNSIQPETNLKKTTSTYQKPDSTYVIVRKNPYAKRYETNRFRGLSRVIKIKGESYLLNIETNVEETEETAIAIAVLTFFFFLVLVIGFLILNKRLSLKLWQPFRSTLRALQTFSLDSQNKIRFEKSDIIEFEELNLALDKLIAHTIAVYKSQKEFTENASHELQTPLAIIKNKLDLLLQKEALTERQYKIIEDINKALTRVSRINKNLLLLAKIENHQFHDSEIVNLSDLLEESMLQLQEHFLNKKLSVKKLVQKDCVVTGNRALLEILINNLLLNAVKHNSINGAIDLKLSASEFVISNSGKLTLEKQQLFRRFKKSTGESSGTGLGLAIIEQICKRHQWKVAYDFRQKTHIFKISF